MKPSRRGFLFGLVATPVAAAVAAQPAEYPLRFSGLPPGPYPFGSTGQYPLRTVTLPDNLSVAYPKGTVITLDRHQLTGITVDGRLLAAKATCTLMYNGKAWLFLDGDSRP